MRLSSARAWNRCHEDTQVFLLLLFFGINTVTVLIGKWQSLRYTRDQVLLALVQKAEKRAHPPPFRHSLGSSKRSQRNVMVPESACQLLYVGLQRGTLRRVVTSLVPFTASL